MKAYLVGGAVRDTLLGLAVGERDWVVTGVTPSDLLERGFKQVGQSFPVFLHPETHEEHALPRGPDAETPATLDQDLRRRDLTINAMALAPDGALIDPLGGERDLRERILRHTPSFRDDPIRVLRLARFAARYHALGFRIAPETLELVRRMVRAGDLGQLVPERVFAEIAKALGGTYPRLFFEVLRQTGALGVILPEIDRLFGVPQPSAYHPEVDTGIHSLMVLEQACQLSPLPEVRFAALAHDVGKGTTPRTEWPHHVGHEARGVCIIQALAARLRLPNRWRDLAVAAARNHLKCHRAFTLRPNTIVKMLESLDAFRRAERFQHLLIVCEADMRGRKGLEHATYPQRAFLAGAREAAAGIDMTGDAGGGGKAIAARVHRARVAAVARFRQAYEIAEGFDIPPPG